MFINILIAFSKLSFYLILVQCLPQKLTLSLIERRLLISYNADILMILFVRPLIPNTTSKSHPVRYDVVYKNRDIARQSLYLMRVFILRYNA